MNLCQLDVCDVDCSRLQGLGVHSVLEAITKEIVSGLYNQCHLPFYLQLLYFMPNKKLRADLFQRVFATNQFRSFRLTVGTSKT